MYGHEGTGQSSSLIDGIAIQTDEKAGLECDLTRKPSRATRRRMLPDGADAALRKLDLSDIESQKWWQPVRSAALVHGCTFAAMLAVGAVVERTPIGGTLLAVGASIALAPLYRGLENLVHGASHSDILGGAGKFLGRRRRDVNDWVGNLIAAAPVGQDVDAFRKGHVRDHHVGFDTERDPCRLRMMRHPDTVKGNLPSLAGTLRQMPRETIAFYRIARGNRRTVLRGFIWHLLFMVAPAATVIGWSPAASAWSMIFLPLFTLTLPTVRTLAEAGEHDYRAQSAGLSVLERTFAHEGIGNRLIHLFGDDRHPEHHLWPGVPQYHLRKAHQRALACGFGDLLRRRTSILGPVEPQA